MGEMVFSDDEEEDELVHQPCGGPCCMATSFDEQLEIAIEKQLPQYKHWRFHADTDEGQWECLKAIALSAKPEDVIKPTRAVRRHDGVRGDLVFPAEETSPVETPATRNLNEEPITEEEAIEMLAKWIEDDEPILPIEYAEEEAVLNTTREVKMRVAADSGAVDHIANPANIPGNSKLRMPKNGQIRFFVGAGGDPIKNHGMAKVKLRTQEGKNVGNIFQVADVTRPLHSVSKVCDSGKEWLFTAEEAFVFPAGLLSKLIKSEQALARYPREGGLYVAEVTVTADDDDLPEGFGRPGPVR